MRLALSSKRRLALLTACALIACATVYSTHALAERTHGHSHCDLCLHFSGTAGSPAHASVIAKPLLTVRVAPFPPQTVRPTRSPLGACLPRGPPLQPSHV